MKKTLFIFLMLLPLLSVSHTAMAQSLSRRQVSSLATLCRLWGFLKYYHPQVAKGRWDWDSVLIKKVPLYLKAKNKKEISELTSQWLVELGTVDTCKTCYQKAPDSLAYNLDPGWINDKTFSGDVSRSLQFIRDNPYRGAHHYVAYDKTNRLLVNFTHEKSYASDPSFQYPAPEWRLLLLFRYWNIVQYFSPYKYLADKNWEAVLTKMIPAFYQAADTLAYQLQYVKLINALGDGHSIVHGGVMERYIGKSWRVPFLCMRIGKKFVVSAVLNDSAAAAMGIKRGDVLLSVSGERVLKKYRRLAPYVISSNEANRAMVFAQSFLFTGADSVFDLTRMRAGKTSGYVIRLSQADISPDKKTPWLWLKDSVAYVNMGELQKAQVDEMMTSFRSAKAIIFDLRSYPKGTWEAIAGYLCRSPFEMSRVSYADLDHPGVFLDQPLKKYGKVNKDPYPGRVILLVDESTVSHAEYSAMGLQAAADVITIGSTTAGKDGNITNLVPLPGGLFTRFSGIGIRYPDGRVTQRRGIKIDIRVRPTIRGLQQGRDEVLEAALQYLQKK